MGICTLFLGLCAAYLYTLIENRITAPFPPILFFVNIPVLLFATFFLRKAKVAFETRNPGALWRNLAATLLLTLIFIVLQFTGWMIFFQHVPLNATQSRSYLFVLSALHLLHVCAGIPFMIWFMNRMRLELSNVFMDWSQRLGYLKGLVRYWNFLDILWILLVAVLSIGYLL